MCTSFQQVDAVLPLNLTLNLFECADCGESETTPSSFSSCPFCSNHFCDDCFCDCIPERQPLELVVAASKGAINHYLTSEIVRSRHLVIAITDNLCSLVHVCGDADRLFTGPPAVDTIFYKQIDPAIQKDQGSREINTIETFEPYSGTIGEWKVDIIPFRVAHELYVASVYSSSSLLPPLFSA